MTCSEGGFGAEMRATSFSICGPSLDTAAGGTGPVLSPKSGQMQIIIAGTASNKSNQSLFNVWQGKAD